MNAPDQSQRDIATDGAHSVIVQAPAGSGKTSLLVTRYLTLLATVNEPEEVLAITFTIKAAGEMRSRVLNAMRDREPAALPALSRSEELGWDLLRSPRRLKIQTIDSFAMGLARSLPRDSGLSPDVQPTEVADDLYQQAADAVLMRLYGDDPFEREIADYLRHCGNDPNRARRLLASMLSKRDQWLPLVSTVMRDYRNHPDALPALLNRGAATLSTALISTFQENLTSSELHTVLAVAEVAADNLGQRLETEPDQFRAIGELLTTTTGELRKTFNKNQGLPPEEAQAKADIAAVTAALRDRALGDQAANLRFLPGPHDDAAIDRLISICICLTIAAVELRTAFERSRTCDFTELMLSAQRALGETSAPTDLALALDHRLRHLLIDEFQDTSVAQFRLFEALLEGWSPDDGNSFFAVGDPMQSIYRFRDAEVGLFYRALQMGVAAIQPKFVSLQSNFRSAPALVNWCNDTFAHVLGTAQDPVLGAIAFSNSTATRPDNPNASARFLLSHSEHRQCRQVVERVQQLLREEDSSSIAVLVRSRGQLAALLPELQAAGIRWQAKDIDSLASKPVVHDLLTIAALFENPNNRQALFSALRAPWCGLLAADLQVLADDLPDTAEILSPEVHYPDLLSADGASRLSRFRSAWIACLPLIHEVPARALVESFWIQMGGTDAYGESSVLAHADLLLTLIEQNCPYQLDTRLLRRAADRLFANDLTPARLQIMTVHKSKGLEFDHVLLPFLERSTRADEQAMLLWRALPDDLLLGCNDDGGVYDWLKREEKVRERHERERLLYVACTRARTTLTLFATMPEKSAAARSLLELLWEPLQAQISRGELEIEDDHAGDAGTVSTDDTDSQWLRSRLRTDYEWRPPVDLAAPYRSQQTQPTVNDEASRQFEVALGIIVHRELELLAQRPLPSDDTWLTGRRVPWRRQALSLGVDESLVTRLVESVAAQLQTVLDDPTGQWILSAREAAEVEYALSFVPDAGSAEQPPAVSHLILDRLFVAQGQRWLIDYKTSSPAADQSMAEFIAAEINRYRPQLRRYQSAAELIFAEPVTVAVYFTALPHLELIG